MPTGLFYTQVTHLKKKKKTISVIFFFYSEQLYIHTHYKQFDIKHKYLQSTYI